MKLIFSCLAASALTLSCGMFEEEEKSSNTGNSSSQAGCVQGVIVDGLTGQKIPVPDFNPDAEEGIHVLVRNKQIPALRVSNKKDGKQSGEYVLCGVPLNETFPIFAWVNSYQVFQSHIRIESTIKPKASEAVDDITRTVPTELANIRLFPQGAKSSGVIFTIRSNNKPVVGAQVKLTPSGGNVLNDYATPKDGGRDYFLNPISTRHTSATKAAGSTGKVLFEGKELTLGGRYSYVILPPEQEDQLVAQAGELEVSLNQAFSSTGLDTPPVAPAEVIITLTASKPDGDQ